MIIPLEIKYTILPWRNALMAGYIIGAALLVLIAYSIFENIFKRKNISMRRGTLAMIGNSVWPICINTCFFALLYWYWALPISLAVSGIFIVIIRGEIRTAYEEERDGRWGLFPEIRKIRGERFADLSVSEQMEYKANVRKTRFFWWLHLPATVAAPFLLVLLISLLSGNPYLFHVINLAETYIS